MCVFLPLPTGPKIGYLYCSIRFPATNLMRHAGCRQLSTRLSERLVTVSLSKWPRGIRLAENAGLNTSSGIHVGLLRVLVVVSKGLCFGLISRPERSWRKCMCLCVCVCVCVCVCLSVIVKPR